MAGPTQRAWRAACPNCGAPVEFASAASASAVCGFCRSTLLRDGQTLKRIGVSAELFDDFSPLQLGASGRHMGAAFTVVGRQQIGYEGGSWNEWHVLFDGGGTNENNNGGGLRSGWLSEDNGAYVMAFDAPLTGAVPDAQSLHAGDQQLVAGAVWSVASIVSARLLAAQGELPAPPRLDGVEFTVADLRNAADEVATLDWRDEQRPAWSVGRRVALTELRMSGLREVAEKTLKGRSIECPSCGASMTPTLATTQSIVCGQCQAVVDVSQGVGAELTHYAQDNTGTQPLIPLGRTGTLQLGGKAKPLPWQVVGYVERCEVDVDAGEEQSAWREYLLYHREEGFSFLVDAEDGWSFASPLTGVPTIKGGNAIWAGVSHTSRYSYTGAVTYVLGEFYWRLQRGQTTRNTDYVNGARRLNREQAGDEVTWSAGEALNSAVVAQAFGLDAGTAQAMQRDVSPVAAGGLGRRLMIYAVIALVLIALIAFMSIRGGSGSGGGSSGGNQRDCSSTLDAFGESSNEYQQCLANQNTGRSGSSRGGSYGGFSSGGGGGGHK